MARIKLNPEKKLLKSRKALSLHNYHLIHKIIIMEEIILLII